MRQPAEVAPAPLVPEAEATVSPIEVVPIISPVEPTRVASSEGERTFVLRPHWIFIWAAISILVTIVLPGAIAFKHGVLTAEQVRAKAAARPACAADPDCRLRTSSLSGSLPAQKGSAPSPVFLGFFESRSTYAYCGAMFALGVLAWWSRRRLKDKPLFAWGTLWRGAVILLVWGGISWIRGGILHDVGRSIFSFLHHDIDRLEFWLQEFRSFILCCLVAHVWLAHGQLAANGAGEVTARGNEPVRDDGSFDPTEVYHRAVDVGRRFDEWQVDSILLAASFFPWTLYYWSLDHRWGDPRYYVSTLIWHLVWGISWWTVSVSALSAWRNFNHYRVDLQARLLIQARLLMSGRTDARGRVLSEEELKARREVVAAEMKWIAEMRPVSTTHLVFAAVASIVTFLLPLLKVVK